jgi:hypothetical protein
MTSLRRSTLGPLSDSQLNNRLSIGASRPAALKPRQSLAPNSLLLGPGAGAGAGAGPVAAVVTGLAGRPSLAGGNVSAPSGSAINPNRQSISMGRPSTSRLSISGSQQQQQSQQSV